MRNPGTITLGDVIVHMLDPRGAGLTRSQRTLPLSEELADYFAAHVRNSLEDGSAKAATFKAIEDDAVSGVCDGLLKGDIGLVPGSRTLARRLYDIMAKDRRISAGDLVVCFYQAANYPDRCLALLKIDPSRVFRHTTLTDDEGRRYVGFEVEEEAMPTTRERLQKCAFVQPLEPRPDYDMLLLDRQAGMARDVAKFFADDFLGADLTFDARARTRILYGSVVSARNQLSDVISRDEQAALDRAIQGAMASDRVDVDAWIDGLPLPQEAKERIETVVAKNLPDRKFDLDKSAAKSLTKRRRFRGDDGLKVEMETGAYRRLVHDVELVEDDPGRPPYHRVVIHTERWEEVTW